MLKNVDYLTPELASKGFIIVEHDIKIQRVGF